MLSELFDIQSNFFSPDHYLTTNFLLFRNSRGLGLARRPRSGTVRSHRTGESRQWRSLELIASENFTSKGRHGLPRLGRC
jgi:hypothetical protein